MLGLTEIAKHYEYDSGNTVCFYFNSDIDPSYSIHIFGGTVVIIIDDDPNQVLS